MGEEGAYQEGMIGMEKEIDNGECEFDTKDDMKDDI